MYESLRDTETKFLVENCQFIDNTASCVGTGQGAGLFSIYSDLSPAYTNVIRNSSFSDNSACRGALYYADAWKHPVDFSGISFEGNSGTFGVGAFMDQGK